MTREEVRLEALKLAVKVVIERKFLPTYAPSLAEKYAEYINDETVCRY